MHRRIHRPTDHAARNEIKHDGQVKPALARWNVSNIPGPNAIRPANSLDVKVTRQQVRRDRQCVIRVGRLAKAARLNTSNSGAFHEPTDSLRPDLPALRTQLDVDARTTVGATALSMCINNCHTKIGVGDRARARCSSTPFVVAGTRYGQQPAHAPHTVVRSLLLDEGVSHRDSLAKNAAAFFKISRSSRRDAFSRRSRRFSSSSEPLTTGSTWACTCRLRHVCNSDGWMPNSRAICVRLCPPVAARRTAASRNSWLNDRRSFPMTPRWPSIRRHYVCVRETGATSKMTYVA